MSSNDVLSGALGGLTALLLAFLLGILLAVLIALGLVSSQSPADLEATDSILTSYGER